MSAYNALRAIDPSSPPDIQGIRDLLDTENRPTRISAIGAFWEYSHDIQAVLPRSIQVLQERGKFLPDVDPILKILGQMGPSASDALPAIRDILEDIGTSTVARVVATNTWTQITPGSPIPAIVR